MPTLLTTEQLKYHLNTFRNLLGHFDYSSIKNITFLNLDAFLAYMDNVKGNPFERQYKALQNELNYLQPYLPFVSHARADEFLEALANCRNEEESTLIKNNYTTKLRDDFIKFSRTVTTDAEWQHVIETCETIRRRKEEMLLASY